MPVPDSDPTSPPRAEPVTRPSDPPDRPGEHPLGPLFSLSVDRSNLARLTGAAVFIGTAAILGVALWTSPSPTGYGTHQKLGLAPCGFLWATGLPCPTCGMTTSFAYTVRGRLLSALYAQPAGTALALFTVLLAGIAVLVMATGRRLEINWYRINPMILLTAALVLFLGAWAFKITVVLVHDHPWTRGG
jgi:hypothetical protein